MRGTGRDLLTRSLRAPGITRASVARVSNSLLRVVVGIGLAVAAGAVLIAVSASLAFASITLLLVVVAASALGFVSGLAAAVAGSALLVYSFVPPRHSFVIDRADDVVAIVGFVAVSMAVGGVVARLRSLRAMSERTAREAQLRLRVATALLEGAAPLVVAEAIAHELVELFELAACTLVGDRWSTQATGPRPGIATVVTGAAALRLEVELGRPLDATERELLDALATGLATAFERARLDQEAREQRVRTDLDRSRAGFLTAVTHDLRTPLATIKAATGALLVPDSALDREERREMLESAYAEAARLERLVSKVLEATRIRSGALHPDRDAVAVADLVRAAVERVGTPAGDRAIELDVGAELPAAWADPTMLEQVLANLLENALRHAPADRAIEVSARAAGHTLELRVVDHGPGIPAEHAERVFEEFVRLDGARGGGAGLGLAVVRGFVEANGGRVWCEQTPTGGATFVLTLPAEPSGGEA